MKFPGRGLLIAALQLLIVLSLGGKLLFDRATRPRVWISVAPVDPELPIRGRYVLLRPHVIAPPWRKDEYQVQAHLEIREGKLFAVPDPDGSVSYWQRTPDSPVVLSSNVSFFIAEHATDPSFRAKGEELWAEVTVPRKGPPRPIGLGVKRPGSDQIEPLNLK
jgi:hypothetical protein